MPVDKQPSTRQPQILEAFRAARKELRSYRQVGHLKPLPSSYLHDIALDFSSQWRILFVVILLV